MIEEADILELLRAGRQESAFELLLERLEVKMIHLARSFVRDESLAEDMAQEIFLKIWKGMKGYSGHSSLSTWAYAIARNTCFTELRRRSMRGQVSMDDPDWSGVAEGVEAMRVHDPEVGMEEEVRGCLDELPDRYRQVLVLYYLEQQSYEEVAVMLGVPMGTVKTHLYRAKRELMVICERKGMGMGKGRGGVEAGMGAGAGVGVVKKGASEL